MWSKWKHEQSVTLPKRVNMAILAMFDLEHLPPFTTFLPSYKHFRLPATVNPNQKFYLIFCQSPPGHLPPPPPHPLPWTQQSFTRPCLAPQGSGISGVFIDLLKHLPPTLQSPYIVLLCLPIFSPQNFSGISQVCGLVPHLNLLHATHSSYLHNLDTRAHSRIRIRIYIFKYTFWTNFIYKAINLLSNELFHWKTGCIPALNVMDDGWSRIWLWWCWWSW